MKFIGYISKIQHNKKNEDQSHIGNVCDVVPFMQLG